VSAVRRAPAALRVAACAVLAGLAACGNDPGPAPEPEALPDLEAAVRSASPNSEPVAMGSGDPVLTLEDAGAEPRSVVSNRVVPGVQGTYDATTESVQEAPTRPELFEKKREVIVAEAHVEEDDHFGWAEARIVCRDFREEGGRRPRTPRVPIGTHVVLTAVKTLSGRWQDPAFRLEPNEEGDPVPAVELIPPRCMSAFFLSVVWPEEAVGVGARWRLDGPGEAMGLSFGGRTVFTLVARDGDTLTVRRVHDGKGAIGKSGALPRALKSLEVLGISVHAETTLSARLDRVVCDSADHVSENVLRARLKPSLDEIDVATRTTTKIRRRK
jgi:hypothetical protein